jgi:hypothetical protein
MEIDSFGVGEIGMVLAKGLRDRVQGFSKEERSPFTFLYL